MRIIILQGSIYECMNKFNLTLNNTCLPLPEILNTSMYKVDMWLDDILLHDTVMWLHDMWFGGIYC